MRGYSCMIVDNTQALHSHPLHMDIGIACVIPVERPRRAKKCGVDKLSHITQLPGTDDMASAPILLQCHPVQFAAIPITCHNMPIGWPPMGSHSKMLIYCAT